MLHAGQDVFLLLLVKYVANAMGPSEIRTYLNKEYIASSLLPQEAVLQTALILYHPALCKALASQKKSHQPQGFNSDQDRQKEKLPNASPPRLRAGIVTRGFWECINYRYFAYPLFPYSLDS